VATTTVGTTMADYADRSLGIGYAGGSLILFTLLMTVLGVWRWNMGSVAVNNIASPKVEAFYWTTILFSNTLGTALGDWLADSGPGYAGGALVFGGALLVVAVAYFFTTASHTLLFWLAFILTRPLGATVGDLLTKPQASGGFDLSRISSSMILAITMIALITFTPQRAGSHPGGREAGL
jgi:uncharacterized membrane-anchored protein